MRYFIENPIISSVFTALTGFFAWLFGGWDALICVLMMAMVMDYITGLMVAYDTKTLSSSIGIKGIFKKIAILIVVALAVQVDIATGNTGQGYFKNLVILMFVANEGLSILENVGKLGVPLPEQLKNALQQIGNSAEVKNNQTAKENKEAVQTAAESEVK